jgi:hypothetical protein
MKPYVEHIHEGGNLIAIILGHQFNDPGVHFVTGPELSQQLAYIRHPAGTHIQAHIHNAVKREVQRTQEALIIRRGQLRVDFYNQDGACTQSRVLVAGDTILLVDGGHGFEVLEEVEIIEVKQGPYHETDKSTIVPHNSPAGPTT